MTVQQLEKERLERIIRVLTNWIKKGELGQVKGYSPKQKEETEKRILKAEQMLIDLLK